MQKHEAHGSSETQITTGGTHQLKALVDLIRDDAFAMSFQSVRQYREALLDAAPTGQGEPAQTHNGGGQHAPDMTAPLELLTYAAAGLSYLNDALESLAEEYEEQYNGEEVRQLVLKIDAAVAAHRETGGSND